MNLSDKFLVAFIVGWLTLAGIFWYKRMYDMSILWLLIAANVAGLEATSYVHTGMTVTNNFKALVQRDPGTGHMLLVGMQSVWLCLLIHLGIPKR